MTTSNRFEINGVIDTTNNVFDNIELMATSSGCFVTWDPSAGHWSVIVNEAGTSVFSFTDSNIITAITVGGTSMNDLYNSVQLEYPHKDLRNSVDYLTVTLPTADRFNEELDNQLTIKLNTINDPIQAQIIASQELKQNRADKIVEFATDFTANGLKAGDLIDITNAGLDFTNKVFRVIQIEEQDTEDGTIIYSITALEYDADVYNTTGLTYDLRTKLTGIKSKIVNDEMAVQDDVDIGGQIGRLLAANAALGLINSLFTVDEDTGAIINEGSFADPDKQAIMEGAGKRPDLEHSASQTDICEGASTTITVSFPEDCVTGWTNGAGCFFNLPNYIYPYTITGVSADDIDVPLTGNLTLSGGTANITIATVDDADVVDETLVFTCGGVSTSIVIRPIVDWTVAITPSATEITEGQSATFSLVTTGIPDGTLPYAIYGAATQSGNITISSGTGSVSVATVDDAIYTGTRNLRFYITMPTVDNCGTGGSTSQFVSVLDNESAPPDPPTPTPTTTCEYVSVPTVWCAVYNGDDNQLEGVTVRASAMLPKALAGEATVTVPLTLTVTKGASSTIAAATTVNIASSAALGGSPFNVLTSFNGVGAKGLITGTASTLYGY